MNLFECVVSEAGLDGRETFFGAFDVFDKVIEECGNIFRGRWHVYGNSCGVKNGACFIAELACYGR